MQNELYVPKSPTTLSEPNPSESKHSGVSQHEMWSQNHTPETTNKVIDNPIILSSMPIPDLHHFLDRNTVSEASQSNIVAPIVLHEALTQLHEISSRCERWLLSRRTLTHTQVGLVDQGNVHTSVIEGLNGTIRPSDMVRKMNGALISEQPMLHEGNNSHARVDICPEDSNGILGEDNVRTLAVRLWNSMISHRTLDEISISTTCTRDNDKISFQEFISLFSKVHHDDDAPYDEKSNSIIRTMTTVCKEIFSKEDTLLLELEEAQRDCVTGLKLAIELISQLGARHNEGQLVSGGIGLVLQLYDDGGAFRKCIVEDIIPKSCAASAGTIRKGHSLLAVNNQLVIERNIEDIVNMIVGPVGTTVSVRFLDVDSGREYVEVLSRTSALNANEGNEASSSDDDFALFGPINEPPLMKPEATSATKPTRVRNTIEPKVDVRSWLGASPKDALAPRQLLELKSKLHEVESQNLLLKADLMALSVENDVLLRKNEGMQSSNMQAIEELFMATQQNGALKQEKSEISARLLCLQSEITSKDLELCKLVNDLKISKSLIELQNAEIEAAAHGLEVARSTIETYREDSKAVAEMCETLNRQAERICDEVCLGQIRSYDALQEIQACLLHKEALTNSYNTIQSRYKSMMYSVDLQAAQLKDLDNIVGSTEKAVEQIASSCLLQLQRFVYTAAMWQAQVEMCSAAVAMEFNTDLSEVELDVRRREAFCSQLRSEIGELLSIQENTLWPWIPIFHHQPGITMLYVFLGRNVRADIAKSNKPRTPRILAQELVERINQRRGPKSCKLLRDATQAEYKGPISEAICAAVATCHSMARTPDTDAQVPTTGVELRSINAIRKMLIHVLEAVQRKENDSCAGTEALCQQLTRIEAQEDSLHTVVEALSQQWSRFNTA